MLWLPLRMSVVVAWAVREGFATEVFGQRSCRLKAPMLITRKSRATGCLSCLVFEVINVRPRHDAPIAVFLGLEAFKNESRK